MGWSCVFVGKNCCIWGTFFPPYFAFHVLYSVITFLYKFFLCLGCASNKQSYRSEKKAGNRSPLLWVLPSSNTWLAIPFLVKELNSTHFSVYYCSQCLWIKISFSSLCGRTFFLFLVNKFSRLFPMCFIIGMTLYESEHAAITRSRLCILS